MSNDSTPFNPYHKLLGIPAESTPPDYYTLLGITMFETDVEVISNAADARMMFLRSFQTGKYAEVVQKVLNEVSAARVCLLNEEQRKAYDAKLRAKLPRGIAVESPSVAAGGASPASTLSSANVLSPAGSLSPTNAPLPASATTSQPNAGTSFQSFLSGLSVGQGIPGSKSPFPESGSSFQFPSTQVPPVQAPPVQTPPVQPTLIFGSSVQGSSTLTTGSPQVPPVQPTLGFGASVQGSATTTAGLQAPPIRSSVPPISSSTVPPVQAPPIQAPPVQAPPVVNGTVPPIAPDLFEIDLAADSADTASSKSGIQRKAGKSGIQRRGNKGATANNGEATTSAKPSGPTYRPVKKRWGLFLLILVGMVALAVGIGAYTGVLQKLLHKAAAELTAPPPSPKAEVVPAEPTPEEAARDEALHYLLDPGVERKPAQCVSVKLNGLEYAFRWCPPGTFQMGSPSNELSRNAAFETQHQVTLTKGFWMLETEVTQEMWQNLMGSNPCPRAYQRSPKCPVSKVLWSEVQDYCHKLGTVLGHPVQLPTEAQWEYACRAGKPGNFMQEPHPEELAWYKHPDNLVKYTHEVAGKKPNEWGLYDMHGNVAEWCLDWFGLFDKKPQTDPVGPAMSEHDPKAQHVVRGGACDQPIEDCRSAARTARSDKQERCEILGFRIVVIPD